MERDDGNKKYISIHSKTVEKNVIHFNNMMEAFIRI